MFDEEIDVPVEGACDREFWGQGTKNGVTDIGLMNVQTKTGISSVDISLWAGFERGSKNGGY